MDQPVEPVRRFDTFTGVFTPTLLTILGVIMYVRLGWVVGNAGLLGAWMIMAVAMGITICTSLSLSSVATNTRIGVGGPYAIISRSLGLEVGGSVGVPLYLSRPLGVAMYIIGFREGWQWMFPHHPAFGVDLAVFVLLFAIAWTSSELAFKVQYGVMAVIAASLLSIFLSDRTFEPAGPITLWGQYPGFPEDGFEGIGFWGVFAVFFPATTGILAGANMSGDLKDPRRAIPMGTLWAVGVASVIYFALAFWAARAGSMDELASNYNLIIDQARWPKLVVAGLLGATFSSALAGIVGGPRILQAMGGHGLMPKSRWVAATKGDGEPRNALLVTGVLTFACLMVRDLNAIVPLVTMFFLITYGYLNFVVLLEDSLGLVSFRPTLRIPRWVPLLGLAGCVLAMFIVSPVFGFVAVVFVMSVYAWLTRVGLRSNGEDVRSGIFVAFAEWAAAKVNEGQKSSVRAWKPNLLVPVEDPETLRGEFHFLLEIASPEGSVKLLGLTTEQPLDELRPRVADLADSFQDMGIYCSWTVVGAPIFGAGVVSSLQALQSAFFRPNILFLTAPTLADRHDEFSGLIQEARDSGVGVMMLGMHPRAGLGQRQSIHLWVRPRDTEWTVDGAFARGNLNLQVLIGFRMIRTWGAKVTVWTVVEDEAEAPLANAFLKELCDLTRLPAETRVGVGSFFEAIEAAPVADLTLLGLQSTPDLGFVDLMVEKTRSSCLLVLDSGRESALA